MRNLLEASRFQLELSHIADSTADGTQLLAACWDTASTDVLCVISGDPDGQSIALSRVKDDGSSDVEATWPTSEQAIVCDLHHFSDTAATILVSSNGDLVKVEDSTVEIVGTVDAGIIAASWSPDEEVLAICTATGGLLLMTRDLDPIQETSFLAEDLKASKHVNVGWGKAETQFQGKGAKAMRDPTVPEKVDQGSASGFDTGDVTISWRGDGAYFAVSRFDTGHRRVIRVYTRDGFLDSVSEPVDGLQHALSWRPSGNIICAVHEINDHLEVMFFERNGLRHGGFPLGGETLEKVTSLAWNSDSSILAISFLEKVQFWTMGNYHWYLKLEYASLVNCSVCWHPEDPQKYMIKSPESLTFHELSWSVSAGVNLEPNDWGVVSVTDGCQLKLTPLRVANVPPPMALITIPMEFVSRDTCISPNGSTVAALDTRALATVHWDFKKRPARITTTNHWKLPEDNTHYRQIIFVDDFTICVLGDSANTSSSVTVFSLEDHTVLSVIPALGKVAVISPVPGRHEIICHGPDGTTFCLDVDSKTVNPLFKLPSFSPTISARITNDELCVFSLSKIGKLYANERSLASSVTSMYVCGSVLAFITSQHTIKFVKLGSAVDDFKIPDDTITLDERCRSVERGARIVCALPSIYSVVLQMPRGNLETIYPRALVLDGIRRSILNEDYRGAFLTCRQHRVDLNILHDLSPERFLRDIPVVIDQLKKPEYIDLFLSQLRDEDVTVTMYPDMETLPSHGSGLPGPAPRKVNRICDDIIAYLRGFLLSAHVQNVVTAYCCKVPPDHESALEMIASLKDTDKYDEAITHICFLSDVVKLYDTALGTYDLELALTIAQRAQKDPREYLPFLQSLQQMESLRRKFVIDDHLGRHTKALQDLYEMGDSAFSEIQKYVVKRLLYTESLELYKYDAGKLKCLTALYAEYLAAENRHREAGLAYEFLGSHSQAAEFYQKAGLWRECLLSIAQIPSDSQTSTTRLQELAQSLAAELVELKDYSSAAQINLDYMNNVAEAVRLLCRASKYSEAMRVAAVHGKVELLTEVVDPSLVESFASTSELLADCKSQLTAQTARVLELREKKNEDPLAYFDGTTDVDAPDDVSLAPTNASTSASLFTRYTGATLATALTGASRKTAKNRRKEERKRARGKKGSVYEEEYLLNSIRRLIERVNSTRKETEHLIECLYRRSMRDNASGLQRQTQEMMKQLNIWVEVMFPKIEAQGVVDAGGSLGAVEGPGSPAPTVDAFESLSLV